MKRRTTLLGLLALTAILAACSPTDAAPTTPPGTPDPDAIHVSSNNLAFSTKEIVAPAGKPFTIVYENKESAPHNIAIYRDETRKEKLFGEDAFSGPKTVTYKVPALQAGTYFFQCDLHPTMKGSLVAR